MGEPDGVQIAGIHTLQNIELTEVGRFTGPLTANARMRLLLLYRECRSYSSGDVM